MKAYKRMMSIIAGAFVLAMLIAGLTYADNEAVKILDAQGQAVGEYETLAAAWAEIADGDTLKILDDIENNEGVTTVTTVSAVGVTLDLNGHTIQTSTSSSDYWLTVGAGATLVVTDSTTTSIAISTTKYRP